MDASTTCPKCRTAIPLADVNVATDLALCRRCSQRWSYAELLADAEIIPVETQAMPGGAWLEDRGPGDFEVGVSTRSPLAFFLVPFMCVWSGGSLGGIYGSQITKGKFDLMHSLFGIPFLLGTLLMGSIALMTIFGKTVVRVRGSEGTTFTGVGPVGWSRRFDWGRVTAIRRTEKVGSKGGVSDQITIDAEKPLNLGVGLSKGRFDFLLATLRRKWRETGGHPENSGAVFGGNRRP